MSYVFSLSTFSRFCRTRGIFKVNDRSRVFLFVLFLIFFWSLMQRDRER